MNKLENLKPQDVWFFFEQISLIPRGTFKEDKVMNYIYSFAKERNLDVTKDKIGNILINKSAQNNSSKDKVILQAHSDMVWTKEDDFDFDFETQGIDLIVDGDFVRANQTTLGADNGIGLAAILAILNDSEMSHPAISALITVSEEQGLKGAYNLGHKLEGTYLINLDTEDLHSITIGCAGGSTITLGSSYQEVKPDKDDMASLMLSFKNLKGGHSGIDINKGRINAIKAMARVLYFITQELPVHIISFDGKGARNAISLNSKVKFLVTKDNLEKLRSIVSKLEKDLQFEFSVQEKNFSLALEEIPYDNSYLVMPSNLQESLINTLFAIPNGVYKLNQHSQDVETSSNIGYFSINHGKIEMISFVRSSINSSMNDLENQIIALAKNIGLKLNHKEEYSAWEPDFNSNLIKKAQDVYQKVLGITPKVEAVHAGLESSIIDKNNQFDKISIGPDIIDPHSTTERVNIKSVEKFYIFLKSLLASL